MIVQVDCKDKQDPLLIDPRFIRLDNWHHNSINVLWKYKKFFHPEIRRSEFRRHLGVHEDFMKQATPNYRKSLLGMAEFRDGFPKSFDARDQWPNCAEVIGKVYDQGTKSFLKVQIIQFLMYPFMFEMTS